MDRRHLSIERVAPSRYLADRRPGPSYGSAGSKAPSPASVARTSRKNVRDLASVARRRRSLVLASLFEQARPAHVGNFALAGNHARFIGQWESRQLILAGLSSRQLSPLLLSLLSPRPQTPAN